MNIEKLTESLRSIINEDVTDEFEKAENKRKLKIYVKAYEALEELQDELSQGIDPVTGKLDSETDNFYNELTEIIDEIYSRSLAFES